MQDYLQSLFGLDEALSPWSFALGLVLSLAILAYFKHRMRNGRILVSSSHRLSRSLAVVLAILALEVGLDAWALYSQVPTLAFLVVLLVLMAVFAWFCGGDFTVFGASREVVEDTVRAALMCRGRSMDGIDVSECRGQVYVRCRPFWRNSILGAITPEVERALKFR